jgi:sigma-B regulation protein RsbU (phosphoserine phosphatase)
MFYSDGLIEAMDSNNELFGTDRLLNIINSNSYNNIGEMKEKIINAVNEFRNGCEQNDDITFVIGKIKTQ